jgi:hypothetical protein
MISFIISAAPLEVYVFPERIKPVIHHKMPKDVVTVIPLVTRMVSFNGSFLISFNINCSAFNKGK